MRLQAKRHCKSHISYVKSPTDQLHRRLRDSLHGSGLSTVRFVKLDVTNLDTIVTAKAQVEREEGKLDVLVNNAGMAYTHVRICQR